ncbi:transcriptional regulator MntR [Candidatus Methanoplasma termitum]|uniref:MntR protein n=1 Tax=Candidatus Methanoplasma termitum TaxID=1577791 RepID=A0A0A7LC81_9ARCH|nr:metal-dependent transcriptional regulator [Candidatus Methanoplasma termitum]AIZ56583.1 transcriptional regulator MntR [Candidatus Methanoplasma termitum]MCL2333830.1 metal-dependent transcriptional regulator [Candidatus Methanoplasma sp.]
MTTQNREDYLINILRLTEGENATRTTELASYMNIAPASVTEMLKILSSEGLVEYEKYHGVKLTEEGLDYARVIRKKHHVLENFLINFLNVDKTTAHNEACRLEHALSEESAIKMCQMLGIQVDSDCQSCSTPCNAVLSEGIRITASLSDLNPGEHGVISHLKNNDSKVIKKLMMMGFIPGRKLTMDPDPYSNNVTIVDLGESVVALPADLASSVFIDTSE